MRGIYDSAMRCRQSSAGIILACNKISATDSDGSHQHDFLDVQLRCVWPFMYVVYVVGLRLEDEV